MKQLKERPEINVLFDEVTKDDGGEFNFRAFSRFMQDYQKVRRLVSLGDLLL